MSPNQQAEGLADIIGRLESAMSVADALSLTALGARIGMPLEFARRELNRHRNQPTIQTQPDHEAEGQQGG